jgi:hypothetical protein
LYQAAKMLIFNKSKTRELRPRLVYTLNSTEIL